uniref:Uncharacterized protein n=1 Tax=Anguilla anguilla TaxID=7936 RepID=A0A0E9R2X9_ANGAN
MRCYMGLQYWSNIAVHCAGFCQLAQEQLITVGSPCLITLV